MCLAERLGSSDPAVRSEAAWECAEIAEALVRALDDACWSVRMGAAAAFGELLAHRDDVRARLTHLAGKGWEAPTLAAAEPAIVACPEVGVVLEREAAAVRSTVREALDRITPAQHPRGTRRDGGAHG